MTNQISTQFSFSPRTFDEALKYATLISKSSFCPKDFRGRPEDVLIAIQMGNEIGLPAIQSIQNIAVINGRPCLWGDGALAVVQNHPHYEWISETLDEEGNAVCTVKRKNHEPHIAVFRIEDAKKARLWGKQGPWSDYPNRMLQLRARGFALRDVFPDALKGLVTREEVEDYEVKPIKSARKVESEAVVTEPLPSASEVLVKHELTDPSRYNTHEELLNWTQLVKTLQLTNPERLVLLQLYQIRKKELEEAFDIAKQRTEEELGMTE